MRHLLETNDCVLSAGCFDALSARIAESVGFKLLSISGYSTATSLIGRPDLGLATMTELADHAARICATVDLPVIADADTGFGGIHNIARTINEFERAGLAAAHIEDQVMPKRAPGLERQLVSVEEAIERIVAACESRRDPDFVIVARCDADEVSYAELVSRSQRYLEAGADLVMPYLHLVDGRPRQQLPPSEQMEYIRRLPKDIGGPLVWLSVPDGFTVDDIGAAGYKVAVMPSHALAAAANAMLEVFIEGVQNGTGEAYFRAHPSKFKGQAGARAVMELMHLDRFLDFEKAVRSDAGSSV